LWSITLTAVESISAVMLSPLGRLYVSFDHTAEVIGEMKDILSAAAVRMKASKHGEATAV
jgi:hypothetical protein